MSLGKSPKVRVTKLGPIHFKTADGLSIKSPCLCKLTPKRRRAQAKSSPATYESVPKTCGCTTKHRALWAVQRHPVPLTGLALPAKILADSRTMGLTFQVTSLLALCLPGCSLTSGYRAVFIAAMAEHDAGKQESQTHYKRTNPSLALPHE